MIKESEDKTSGNKSSWFEQLKSIVPIFGPLSFLLALATFIGFKPEKGKQLEWYYSSKSSLINTSAASSDKIAISYDGQKIRQLSVIAARLTNSGNLPIEAADVKDGAFPTVTFPSGSAVIGAQIKNRLPPNLRADVIHGTNFVRVEHGLLNPSDFIEVQILLEGETGDIKTLPEASFRIAGITKAITRFPSDTTSSVRPAYFSMPRGLEYFILFFASSATLVLLIVSVAFSIDAVNAAFPKRSLDKKLSNAIYSAFSNLDKDQQTPGELQVLVASKLHAVLDAPFDAMAHSLALQMPPLRGETAQQFRERLLQELRGAIFQVDFWLRMRRSSGQVTAAVFFFLMGLSCLLITFAGWARAFTGD